MVTATTVAGAPATIDDPAIAELRGRIAGGWWNPATPGTMPPAVCGMATSTAVRR